MTIFIFGAIDIERGVHLGTPPQNIDTKRLLIFYLVDCFFFRE